MTAITRLLTLEEAARRLGIKPGTLIRYAKAGKIGAKLFVVENVVQNGEPMTLVALEKMPAPHRFGDDKPSEEISLREASRRYGVPHSLLSRWIRLGLLELKGRHGKEYRVSSEAVRQLAEIYHQIRQQHGGSFRGRRMHKILQARGLLDD